jgi:hypothetical protein
LLLRHGHAQDHAFLLTVWHIALIIHRVDGFLVPATFTKSKHRQLSARQAKRKRT